MEKKCIKEIDRKPINKKKFIKKSFGNKISAKNIFIENSQKFSY